ncbi:unnamed protein product, partial [marine sediment metagenome]
RYEAERKVRGKLLYAKQTQFPKDRNEHKLSYNKGL